MIKVVIIDDSAFMRKALEIMLKTDPEIEIVGTARDGQEGYETVKRLRPDIVTLDIEMPRTNGLEALKLIMSEVPTPVLVVSSITTRGANVTLEAMELGAVDFIAKTQSFVAIDITKIKGDLIQKIKAIAKGPKPRRRFFQKPITSVPPRKIFSRTTSKVAPPFFQKRGVGPTIEKPSQPVVHKNLSGLNIKCVAIGVSTGGPPVVTKILASLPANFPVPIIIAQHMPKEFTGSFSTRLNTVSSLSVKEGAVGDILKPGHVFIGQGGSHMRVKKVGGTIKVDVSKEPSNLLYFPSVDVMVSSAVEVYGSSLLTVILTGMGRDGMLGARNLHDKRGKVLAQNEESCVVYGMPKAVVDDKTAEPALSIEGLIESLKTLVK